MMSFYEYIAAGRKITLPDAQTMLSMADVPLGFPDDEETERLLNRDRKQRPAGNSTKTIVPLDRQPLSKARKRI